MRQIFLMLSMVAALGVLPETAGSQSYALDLSPKAELVTSETPNLSYTRPTKRAKARSYVFDTIGPYPLGYTALSAGIDQWNNSPLEWKQGAQGYARRFASDFGMAAVGTTTRYALSEVFHEDNLYYQCECEGILPRASHAAISAFTARRGLDGRRAFSFSALLAPYVGSTTAVYGWYPDRYGPKDAFRIGNYSLLTSMGGNLALEFLRSGSHSLLAHLHRKEMRGSPAPGTDH